MTREEFDDLILSIVGIIDVNIWSDFCDTCPVTTITEASGLRRDVHLSKKLAQSYLQDCITVKAKNTLTKFILENS
jgi:hypothetical protein